MKLPPNERDTTQDKMIITNVEGKTAPLQDKINDKEAELKEILTKELYKFANLEDKLPDPNDIQRQL